MSKNAFLMLLGGLIATTLGGIAGLISYALIALLMLLAGLIYEGAYAFVKGFGSGLKRPPPKRERPCLYLVK